MKFVARDQHDSVNIAFRSDRIAGYLSTFIDEDPFDHLQCRAVDNQPIQIEHRSSLPQEPVRVWPGTGSMVREPDDLQSRIQRHPFSA